MIMKKNEREKKKSFDKQLGKKKDSKMVNRKKVLLEFNLFIKMNIFTKTVF
jgi:hypothetical protein